MRAISLTTRGRPPHLQGAMQAKLAVVEKHALALLARKALGVTIPDTVVTRSDKCIRRPPLVGGHQAARHKLHPVISILYVL